MHHAAHVLRVREGEEIELFDARGTAVAGRIASIGRDEVTIAVTGNAPPREPSTVVTLAMAIIQLDKFELVLQKAVELGATTLIPLRTDRCEVREERYRGKTERWKKIVFEAAKQCGRAVVPSVQPPTGFDEIVARDGSKILFDADASPSPPRPPEDRVVLLVGPEGGWSETEIALAQRHDCRFERLGPRRLRAETAAIAALVLMNARAGDI